MAPAPFVSFLLIFFFFFHCLNPLPCLGASSTRSSSSLCQGCSLSVEKKEQDVLVSPNGSFSAGFYPVGENAYVFAIWLTQPINDGTHTLVWIANRDKTVNGKLSRFFLTKTGNLLLTDAAQTHVWSSSTTPTSPVTLFLHNNGNLVLRTTNHDHVWQSFDFPTDTLLPGQPLSRSAQLVSSRCEFNYSTGYYRLYFDNDNVLRLLYKFADQISSVFWPAPWRNSWENGRSAYNNTRIAMFDSLGKFVSSDNFNFLASDYGDGVVMRRLTMDFDGNLRMYSLDVERKTWEVSGQVIAQSCQIHGICGINSFCDYDPSLASGKKCSCLPGYKLKDPKDWSLGCEADFHSFCDDDKKNGFDFVELPQVEFFGFDLNYTEKLTLKGCQEACIRACNCLGIQYSSGKVQGVYSCYLKTVLLSGNHSPDLTSSSYIKVPNNTLTTSSFHDFKLNCSGDDKMGNIESRLYKKPNENKSLQLVVWIACGFGAVEITLILFVCCILFNKSQKENTQNWIQSPPTKFRRFTYKELKKATDGFKTEIGRGGCGVVYIGKLSDERNAAIKMLVNDTSHGEYEFLAEVNTIGRLNHMHLIDMWGYCVEGKHRLLVYEYIEHGSLSDNLISDNLSWEKRFNIAVGTAKGLAYLHEECLEWILHCDVKPQNILLDSDYQPKVADFGLSKLVKREGERGGTSSSTSFFSRVRGTRGYMAPEWILNLPITSKVDVYSYGIVMLEMVTGKSIAVGLEERGSLVKWVKDEMRSRKKDDEMTGLEKIVDPTMKDGCEWRRKMEVLVEVALQCVEEDRDARPTMSQVVAMLSCQEDDSEYSIGPCISSSQYLDAE